MTRHLRLVAVDNVDNDGHTGPMTADTLTEGDRIHVQLTRSYGFEATYLGPEDQLRVRTKQPIRMAKIQRDGGADPELVFFPTITKES